MKLHKLDSKRLGFNPLKTLHFSEKERALLIKNDNDLKSLYPDFIFREK